MRYKILGDSDCPLVHIQLDMNEKVKIERGAMAYVSNVCLLYTSQLFYNKKYLSNLNN